MPSNNTIKIAAAGSGKTWGICHNALSLVTEAEQIKKILITTFTNKGIEAIERELKKQNYGVLSNQIVLRSWYEFLLYDLIRPYQTYIAGINEIRSFDFSNIYGSPNFHRQGTKSRYINPHGDVRANFASELVIQLNTKSNGCVIERLQKIYSHIFVDEIQDMAGYDLDIISLLMESDISTICVGDGKQATYKTHNTRKGRGQTGSNIWTFFYNAKDKGNTGIVNDTCSRRFNRRICRFANFLFPNENNITTSMNEQTEHDGVFLICKNDVNAYYNYFHPTVLKYDKNTPTYGYNSLNFGQCKGLTFDRVLIFPNEPMKNFIRGKSLSSPYKYYVAVTRPKYSLAIVVDKLPDIPEYQTEAVKLGELEITAKSFIVSEDFDTGE